MSTDIVETTKTVEEISEEKIGVDKDELEFIKWWFRL